MPRGAGALTTASQARARHTQAEERGLVGDARGEWGARMHAGSSPLLNLATNLQTQDT